LAILLFPVAGMVAGCLIYSDVQRSHIQHKLDRALVDAIDNGPLERAPILLARGADPDARWEPDETIWKRLTQRFSNRRHTPPLRNDLYSSVLMIAAERGYSVTVDQLIRHGADVNAEDGGGYSPLINASVRGHLGIVKRLIKSGARINATDIWGRTALMSAVESGSRQTAHVLVANGANVGVMDLDGRTAMSRAKGNSELTALLRNPSGKNSSAGIRNTANRSGKL